MQRREQQRRTAAAGPGAGYLGSGLGGGASGYASIPQRFEAPTPVRAASPAAPARTPQFKKSGMQLGGKKTTQSQLLDALGGEVLLSEDMSAPATPTPEAQHTHVQKATSSLPAVTPERCALSHRMLRSLCLSLCRVCNQRAHCRPGDH